MAGACGWWPAFRIGAYDVDNVRLVFGRNRFVGQLWVRFQQLENWICHVDVQAERRAFLASTIDGLVDVESQFVRGGIDDNSMMSQEVDGRVGPSFIKSSRLLI